MTAYNDRIRTSIYIDVEHSLVVAGDDSVQDPPTRPRILVGRLDSGKCVRCHADVPRDVVSGAAEHRWVIVDVTYLDCDQRRCTGYMRTICRQQTALKVERGLRPFIGWVGWVGS